MFKQVETVSSSSGEKVMGLSNKTLKIKVRVFFLSQVTCRNRSFRIFPKFLNDYTNGTKSVNAYVMPKTLNRYRMTSQYLKILKNFPKGI